jgi:lysozyme
MTWEHATLGVDLSHWQPRVDWKALASGGVTFAVLKATQGRSLRDGCFETHYQGARAVDLLVGAYHWLDPNQAAQAQAEAFLAALRGKRLDFLALDVEQYWVSWAEWQAGHITRFVNPQRIAERALAVARRVRFASGLPLLIYTRTSFVLEYARPMLAWLAEWPLWLAQYPYRGGRITCAWEALRAHFLPQARNPILPPGCPTWQIWQFSAGRFTLPGATTPLDLNLFNGDGAALRAWCEHTPTQGGEG